MKSANEIRLLLEAIPPDQEFSPEVQAALAQLRADYQPPIDQITDSLERVSSFIASLHDVPDDVYKAISRAMSAFNAITLLRHRLAHSEVRLVQVETERDIALISVKNIFHQLIDDMVVALNDKKIKGEYRDVFALWAARLTEFVREH